jgi:hypothetical protein
MNKNNLPSKQSNFLLDIGNDGEVKVDVFLKDETILMTQKVIGKQFKKSKATINEHLKKIYAKGEMQIDSTVRNFRIVLTEGSRQVEQDLEFYNIDAVISVHYRINSYQATQFRIWATRTLKEYIIKGFVLDDEWLKHGNQIFGGDYFDEISTNNKQICTLKRLRDTLLFKHIYEQIRIRKIKNFNRVIN